MKQKIKQNIKIRLSNVMLIGILFLALGCAEDQSITKLQTLVLQDEFNIDGAPDSSIWTFDIGTGENGWGNNELQYYTDRAENIVVEDGMLKITAIKESYQGSAYTSARIKTEGLFEQAYGRFEARMKLPYGQGMWPAFWLLGNNLETVGWPQCGEIDIMEYRGQNPTDIAGSVHGPGYSSSAAITKEFTIPNDRFDTDFHVFGVEWTPNSIKYYVDNILYNEITPSDVTGDWVFDHPFYMIINLAVGGSFVGAPNDNTVFPQTLYIDYVRVYQ